MIKNKEDADLESTSDQEEKVQVEEDYEMENEEKDEDYRPQDNANNDEESVADNIEEERKDNDDTTSPGVRIPTRDMKVPTRLGTLYQYLHRENKVKDADEYSSDTALVLMQIISHIRHRTKGECVKRNFISLCKRIL